MVSEKSKKKDASKALYDRLENALGDLQDLPSSMEAKTPQGASAFSIKRLEEDTKDNQMVLQLSTAHSASEETRAVLKIAVDVEKREAQAVPDINLLRSELKSKETDKQGNPQKSEETAKRADRGSEPAEQDKTSASSKALLEEKFFHASNIATVKLFDKLSEQGCRFERQHEQSRDKKEEPVGKKFADAFARNPEKYISEYRKEFGNYLCTDNALNLCKEYREGTPEEKARYAPLMGETVSSIVKGVYDEMVKESAPPGKYNTVAFVSGGMASGKSTEIARLKEQHHIIYEVVKGLSEEKIEKAFDHGKKVAVFHIHRPVEHAAESLIPRSEKEGRTPSLKFFTEGHYESQKILFQRLAKYGDRDDFSVEIIDNSRFGGSPRNSSIEFLCNNAYKSIEEVEKRAKGAIENVYRTREEQGKPIPEFITGTLKREELERNHERISSTDDRGRSRCGAERDENSQERREINHTIGSRSSRGRSSEANPDGGERISNKPLKESLLDTEKQRQSEIVQISHQKKIDNRER